MRQSSAVAENGIFRLTRQRHFGEDQNANSIIPGFAGHEARPCRRAFVFLGSVTSWPTTPAGSPIVRHLGEDVHTLPPAYAGAVSTARQPSSARLPIAPPCPPTWTTHRRGDERPALRPFARQSAGVSRQCFKGVGEGVRRELLNIVLRSDGRVAQFRSFAPKLSGSAQSTFLVGKSGA